MAIDSKYKGTNARQGNKFVESPTRAGEPAVEVVSSDSQYAAQIDESGNTTYFGFAAPGSLTSAAVWRVMRSVKSGNSTAFTYADGNADFDNIWDDRASLTYS